MTDEEIKVDALRQHPDCKFAMVVAGLDNDLNLTRAVRLWPDEHSYRTDNLPKYEVNGYSPYNGNGPKHARIPLK